MSSTPDASMSELSDTLTRTARLIKAYRHLTPAVVPGLDAALVPLVLQLEEGPRRVTELAEGVHSEVSTVSRQISQLTRLGLVAKQPHPLDGRALQVTLTPAGRQALAEVRRRRDQAFALFLADWQPQEVDDFHVHLKRLLSSVESAYRAERSPGRVEAHQPDPRTPHHPQSHDHDGEA